MILKVSSNQNHSVILWKILNHLHLRICGYLDFSSSQWRKETPTESISSLHLWHPLLGCEFPPKSICSPWKLWLLDPKKTWITSFRTQNTAKSGWKINSFLGRTERYKGIKRSKKAALHSWRGPNDNPEEQQTWSDTAGNNFTTIIATEP